MQACSCALSCGMYSIPLCVKERLKRGVQANTAAEFEAEREELAEIEEGEWENDRHVVALQNGGRHFLEFGVQIVWRVRMGQ